MTTLDVSPGRRRALLPARRSQLERDIAEIRADLKCVATKEDIEDVKRHIDARTADILEAIEWKKSPSGSV